jgi:pimeloyl-ACP methyl ester carboxylesterase
MSVSWIPKLRFRLVMTVLAAALLTMATVLSMGASARTHRLAPRGRSAAKPTVVFEHGAWADSSGFGRVARRLQAAGYTVMAPADPLRSLATDSAYLKSFLSSIQGPIILVGHSYGGMVITDAATGDAQVKALVYIDAYAPAAGESALQLTDARPGSLLNAPPQDVFNFGQDPGLPTGDPDLYVKPSLFRQIAADLSPAKAAVLAATQRPIAGGALQGASTTPAWKTIPSWYLEGTADKVIPPAEQTFMADRAGSHLSRIDASHFGWTIHPRTVASIIENAANATN